MSQGNTLRRRGCRSSARTSLRGDLSVGPLRGSLQHDEQASPSGCCGGIGLHGRRHFFAVVGRSRCPRRPQLQAPQGRQTTRPAAGRRPRGRPGTLQVRDQHPPHLPTRRGPAYLRPAGSAQARPAATPPTRPGPARLHHRHRRRRTLQLRQTTGPGHRRTRPHPTTASPSGPSTPPNPPKTLPAISSLPRTRNSRTPSRPWPRSSSPPAPPTSRTPWSRPWPASPLRDASAS